MRPEVVSPPGTTIRKFPDALRGFLGSNAAASSAVSFMVIQLQALKRRRKMLTKRLKEACALTMVGDGILTAIDPQRHLNLWKIGPKPCVRAVDALVRHPRLTRVIGVAAAATGIWWASRQRVRPAFFLRRSA
jgi:hypothetical protein